MAEEKKDQSDDKKVTREELDEKQALEATEQINSVDEKPMEIKKQSKLKAFLSTKKGKVTAALLVLAVVTGVVLGVPATRYGTLGYFVKKDVRVSVIDASTKKPVSDAVVKLDGRSVKTSAKGEATLKNIPVGEYKVTITKKYYKDASSSYTVPILSSPKLFATDLQATGRQVEIRVTNMVTKTALSKASIVVGGTSAITDDKGVAVVVLPADKKTLSAMVGLVGYNDKKVSVAVTEQLGKNNFSLTPEGKLFYLSNQTGTVDVMKSNLDGSESTIVVKGTGNESSGTSLTATSDWRYLLLSAHRTTDTQNQLYLVDTKTGAMKTIDRGNVAFSVVGWSGHTLVYQVYRYDKQIWETGRQAFKSFNADTSKLTSLDESFGGTSDNEYDSWNSYFTSGYLVGGKLVYGINWRIGAGVYSDIYHNDEYQTAIVSVNLDGTDKKRIKAVHQMSYSSMEIRQVKPNELYVKIIVDKNSPSYFIFKDGLVTSTSISDAKFYIGYPTYLGSLSGDKTFWQEYRDGKSTLFEGDKNGMNSMTIASLSDFSAYGWFGDNYLLLSKGGNELFIAPAGKALSDSGQPFKVTNYFN